MNKPEVINAIAKRTGVKKRQVALVMNAFFGLVGETLQQGRKMKIVGFGTFETHTRKTRTVTVPTTGEVARVPNRTVPVFRPGKDLKDAVE